MAPSTGTKMTRKQDGGLWGALQAPLCEPDASTGPCTDAVQISTKQKITKKLVFHDIVQKPSPQLSNPKVKNAQ